MLKTKKNNYQDRNFDISIGAASVKKQGGEEYLISIKKEGRTYEFLAGPDEIKAYKKDDMATFQKYGE